MKKLFLLSFLLMALIANGRQISESEAASIASEFLGSTSVSQNVLKSVVRRAPGKNVEQSGDAPFYIFNATDGNGFVIISGDDRTKKILGYSDAGSFDNTKLPPQFATILDKYAEQINQLPTSVCTDSSWETPTDASANATGVLLKTANWGQDYPYNLQTPVINDVHCPTGCVPTAMAIMMQYYNWPERGKWQTYKFLQSGFIIRLRQLYTGLEQNAVISNR